MAKGINQKQPTDSGLNFEAQLLAAPDKIRGHMDTTWKLARMNLAIRGIDANFGPRNADSFRADLHLDLKADFMPVRNDLANRSLYRLVSKMGTG